MGLQFWINGNPVRLSHVSPTALLVDYLRQPDVGLTGTKKVCAQGGCGACTVMVSRYDPQSRQVVHCSINSCLHALGSLDGTAVTTIEGTGSVRTKLSPVQHCIAKENGTQCGFCTPGWVMHMHAFLAARNGSPATQAEIERLFDGNLCRCTGYRPILHAMKHFASDWSAKDVTMTCEVDPADDAPAETEVTVDLPPGLKRPPRALHFSDGVHEWRRPMKLADAYRLLAAARPAKPAKLVCGNTSIGVYPPQGDAPTVWVDISQLPELRETRVGATRLHVGAAVTYTELIDALDAAISRFKQTAPEKATGLAALRYLAGRTAGMIVRNAASLGGNTMLVIRHVRSGVPFPSDLFTALVALDATVRIGCSRWGQPKRLPLLAFAGAYQRTAQLRREAILLGYEVPLTRPREFAQTYKAARREVNAHAIVNAGFRVRFDRRWRVIDVALALGGIGPIAFRAQRVERFLRGRTWDPATLQGALARLEREIQNRLRRYRARMAQVPSEGFAEDYLAQLGLAFFYKFFVQVALTAAPALVPASVADAGRRYERPPSRGTQRFRQYAEEFPINRPFIKHSAFLQASGESIYTHDLPVGARGLHGVFVLSTCARGEFRYRLPGARPRKYLRAPDLLAHLRQRFPGVVDYLTCQDVPGKNVQGSGGDDPIFAERSVIAYGQSLGLVVATNAGIAEAAADYVTQRCVDYPRRSPPLLTIEAARAAQPPSVFEDNPSAAPMAAHIWKVTRPGSDFSWAQGDRAREVRGAACRVVQGRQRGGSQIHFYFETQSCVAERGEHSEMLIQPSSQVPDSIQNGVAQTLGIPVNQVVVRIKRLGGSYGGKCSRSLFVAAPAALAAWKHHCPVKVVLRREDDTAMIGHRHSVCGEYQLAIATGEDHPERRGQIMGWRTRFWLDGGCSYDCSFAVLDAVQLGADTAYYVPNFGTEGDVCRTNLPSNTAMRSFGMIQNLLVQEEALEAASHAVGMLPEDVRARNLYRVGDATPYGQRLDDCDVRPIWEYLEQRCRFRQRLEAVTWFNASHRWRKRGLSMIPMKYPLGFNLPALEQAGALVEVFDQDGTVLVRHGGVEMGQGIMIKVAQIAAAALNVPLGAIRILETDTSVVPNPIGTGASTGSSFNGAAVNEACGQLRRRLEAHCLDQLTVHGADWCRQQEINFWDYPDGWRSPVPGAGKSRRLIWNAVVALAGQNRINLSAQTRTPIPGGTAPMDAQTLTYKKEPGSMFQFTDFAYTAACSEVEIDVLTGETTILRSDLVYDLGRSLNPAVDIGQIEGAFVQGVGYVTTEELVHELTGPDAGRLNTLNTWNYKVPAATSIPLELHIDLFPRENASSISPNPNLLRSSKEVGEPPMTLAITVFFAIKHAILAARRDRGHDEWFALESPATVQRVREACLVGAGDLRL